MPHDRFPEHVFSDFPCPLLRQPRNPAGYRSIEECRRISDNNGAFLDKVTAGVRNYFLLPYGDHHAVIRSRKILLCSRRKKNRRDVPFLMSPKKKREKKEKITVRSNSFVQAAKEYSE